jgi:hypothetical protein
MYNDDGLLLPCYLVKKKMQAAGKGQEIIYCSNWVSRVSGERERERESSQGSADNLIREDDVFSRGGNECVRFSISASKLFLHIDFIHLKREERQKLIHLQ